MSADYDPDGIPPQWALDMAADEACYSSTHPWREAEYWGRSSQTFKAFARRIWRAEEPPVDPMLAVMREAIARYEDAETEPGRAEDVRSTWSDGSVTAALAYLREVGALVDKLHMSADLYESGYSIPRMPKNAERTSMVCSGKGRAGDRMRGFGCPEDWGDPIDALGYFADDGCGQMLGLVADYSNGKRVTYRRLKGRFTLTIEVIK